MNVAPALIWLTLGSLACGEDPVLKAAHEEAAAARTGQGKSASGGGKEDGVKSRRGHPIDGGVASGSSQPDGSGAVVPDEPVPGIPEDPTPAPAGTPGGGTPPEQGVQEGKPSTPRLGIPEEPTPGRPEDPSPSGRRPPTPSGPTVTLSGEVVFAEFVGGIMRVDIFDGDHLNQGGKRPSVVAQVEMERPGPFSVEVPESARYVWVSAFNDADRNERPGPQDPSGFYIGNPVPTTRGDQAHLIVRLIQRAPPEEGGDDL